MSPNDAGWYNEEAVGGCGKMTDSRELIGVS